MDGRHDVVESNRLATVLVRTVSNTHRIFMNDDDNNNSNNQLAKHPNAMCI